MRRPVIVAVCGMVGTGKTTAVKHIEGVLRRHGIEAAQWRFQRLPCISFKRTLPPGSKPEPFDRGDRTLRGQGYRARTLTWGTTLGYLVRSFAFRVYRRWPRPSRWVISNRYFYDSFAHFDLEAGHGPLYTRILQALLPKPDLAFLMLASPQTLAARRPQYSAEYITRVDAGYQRLRELFPDLIEISSETDAHGFERLERSILQRIGN
jgi:thymidylate kinase